MIQLDPAVAAAFIAKRINRSCCPQFKNQVPAIIDAFIEYDAQYMDGLTVSHPHAESDDIPYDEDDAVEFILEAYLDRFPLEDELSMQIAALLDQYVSLMDQYLQSPESPKA